MANILVAPMPCSDNKLTNRPKILRTYVTSSGGDGDTRPASGQMQPR